MANDHRGRFIADPFINTRNAMIAQQEMLAQRNAGLQGLNYNPEESTYDEAYGPSDRTKFMSRKGGVADGMSGFSDFADEQTNVEDRRVKGEN
jgi:hypothetical protein